MTDIDPTSHKYFSQRLKLHYVDWGNAGAPPLLLIHGGRDHGRSWDWVAKAFRNDYHVIVPDLRGHGDSQWVDDGNYPIMHYVYDIAQLIHQKSLAPLTIIAHSMGGGIALRYAGLYPDNVEKLIVIDGAFPDPRFEELLAKQSVEDRLRKWIEDKRAAAARVPRRYASLDDAFERMKKENKFLSDEQARHLTVHGIDQNEDGTYTWKFDNHFRVWPNVDISVQQAWSLWKNITCPILLCYGEDSFAQSPDKDERMALFQNARLEIFEQAGHWVHHDQTEKFIRMAKDFLL